MSCETQLQQQIYFYSPSLSPHLLPSPSTSYDRRLLSTPDFRVGSIKPLRANRTWVHGLL